MSAATDSLTEIVHVRLLEEATNVWRPVRARRLASGAYELAAEPAPGDETWEFAPGECVLVKTRSSPSDAATIAVARAPDQAKPRSRR